MIMEAGGDETWFKPRWITGVDLNRVVRDVSGSDGSAAINDDRPEHYVPEADDTEDDVLQAGEVSA